jgi:uncharacterized membrane protein
LGEIVKQVVIEASAKKVYSYVADPRNAPHYISSITRIVAGPDGAPAKGNVWRAEANFFGQKRVLNLRLDEMVANRAVRFALDGDPQALLLLRLSPDGDSGHTAVSLTLEVPSVPTVFLNALLGRLLSDDLERLKTNLEA